MATDGGAWQSDGALGAARESGRSQQGLDGAIGSGGVVREHSPKGSRELGNLAHHPQASSRVLSPQEQRAGLGSLSLLPAELIKASLLKCGQGDLAVAARGSRALNEHVLPVLMDWVNVKPGKGVQALCDVVDRLYRLNRLGVRQLVIYEDDALLPHRLVITTLAQIGERLEGLIWMGGQSSVAPHLPDLPLLHTLEVHWKGSLHIYDGSTGDTFFGRLLAPGTTKIETLEITTFETAGGPLLSTFRERVRAAAAPVHMLGLNRVFEKRPSLLQLSIYDGAASSWQPDRTAVTFSRPSSGHSKLANLRITGTQFAVSSTCYVQLLSTTPCLTDLDLPGVRIVDDLRHHPTAPKLPSLRSAGGSVEEILNIATAIVAPRQLDEIRLSGSVNYPSDAFEKILQETPRALLVGVNLQDGARFPSTLRSIIEALPTIEELRLWFTFSTTRGRAPLSSDTWLDVSSTLADLAPRLRKLVLEVSRWEIDPPASPIEWAVALFEKVCHLQVLELRGDVVKNIAVDASPGAPPLDLQRADELRLDRVDASIKYFIRRRGDAFTLNPAWTLVPIRQRASADPPRSDSSIAQ